MKNNKIRIISFVLLVVVIVVAFYSNISMKLTKEAFRDMDASFKTFQDAYSCIDSFETGSEYLTEQVRKYAINMNRDYVDNYFKEADNLKRRESALERLKSFSKTSQLEIQLFEEAMEMSKELENDELHAMKLLYSINPYEDPNERIVEYKLTKLEENMSSYDKQRVAYEIVFGTDYNAKKAKIDENIKIGKNLIAENNLDINNHSVQKAEAAIELLSAYWGMFAVISIGSLAFITIYEFSQLFKKKKHVQDEQN